MSYAVTPHWMAKRRMMAMSGRRGRRGWGYQPRGGFPMGPGPFSRRPRVGRGDVRAAILHLLAEAPMHGYQISDRSDGMWQPSPGSVYPTLQQLEDEGLVSADEREGKKTYNLTDEGTAKVESHGDTPPWERFESDAHEGFHALREVGFQVGAAVMQVARAGSEAQVAGTRQILEDARRRIYQILAEGEPES